MTLYLDDEIIRWSGCLYIYDSLQAFRYLR